MGKSSKSSVPQSNNMDSNYENPTAPPSSFPSFEGRQFTVNLKPPTAQNTHSTKVHPHFQVKAPKNSVLSLDTPLLDGLQDLKFNEDQPPLSFEKDIEDAWKNLVADGNNGDQGSKMVGNGTRQQTRRNNLTSAYRQSKLNIQQPVDRIPSMKCYKCGVANRYRVDEAWTQTQTRPHLFAPNSKATRTHLNIVSCVNCSSGTCIACGKPPHFTECTFADSRATWRALSSIDKAVVKFRHVSSVLTTVNTTQNVHPVLLEALTAVITAVPRTGPLTFGLRELLRNSLLLDLIADIMRGMTVETIELSPLLIQTWEFLYMVAKRSELIDLFFETRQVLNGTSPGLLKLKFPLVLLPIQQSFSGDLSNTARNYNLWSMMQNCVDISKQYLEANHDDVWSAAMVAKRVIDVYEILAIKVPPKHLTPVKIYHNRQLAMVAGIRDLYKMGSIRKSQEKITPAQAEIVDERPRKKRGHREPRQDQSQDDGNESRGGKRRKTVGG